MEATAIARSALALADVGKQFHSRGWSLATSSNYSVVLSREPLRLLLTASGLDKSNLQLGNFVTVDETGKAVSAADPKPSAETLLHVVCAKQPNVGAVLHTHSVWGTLLSDAFAAAGGFALQGYEMQKGLAGINSHQQELTIPIFENTQTIPDLARQVEHWFETSPSTAKHCFLIRRHGLYTWGKDLDEARRHVEALEFLFEVSSRAMTWTGAPAESRPRPLN